MYPTAAAEMLGDQYGHDAGTAGDRNEQGGVVFDEYLSGLSDEERQALQAVIDAVSAAAPQATEGRSYGVPAFRYKGKPLLGFAATKDHLSLYPFSPQVLEAVQAELDGYGLSKGSIRFTVDRPIPAQVLTEMVGRRMREIDGE